MDRPVVGIHQPNYIPWLGFFYKIAKSDVFILLDNVQFTKNSIQNRNKIKTPQGELLLTVPVLTKGKFGQATNEVEVNNTSDWRRTQWKTIQMNYSRAPHFQRYAPHLQSLFEKPWTKLVDICEEIIRFVVADLGFTAKILKASGMNPTGSSTELLIDLCKKAGGKTYLSGRGGKNYQDEEKFKAAGIALEYYDFAPPTYPQLHGAFMPNLSILDLLFNCGPDSRKVLLGE